jgi:hypothetical protein
LEALSYTLKYRENGVPNYIWKSAVNSQKWLVTLNAGTQYEVLVKSRCTGLLSSWSDLFTFNTEDCGKPTNISVNNITTSYILVNYTSQPGYIKHKFQYRVSGTSIWTTQFTLNAASKWVVGLASNTTYEYRIKSLCTYGWSSYSTVATFTTASSRQAGDESRIELVLNPNPASHFINVDYVTYQQSPVGLKIFDIYGKLVWENEVVNEAGNHQMQIELDGFENGYYLVQLSNSEKLVTQRLVIMK